MFSAVKNQIKLKFINKKKKRPQRKVNTVLLNTVD